jgi:hypothetical protein
MMGGVREEGVGLPAVISAVVAAVVGHDVGLVEGVEVSWGERLRRRILRPGLFEGLVGLGLAAQAMKCLGFLFKMV